METIAIASLLLLLPVVACAAVLLLLSAQKPSRADKVSGVHHDSAGDALRRVRRRRRSHGVVTANGL
jgi:hypothetical protein